MSMLTDWPAFVNRFPDHIHDTSKGGSTNRDLFFESRV